VARCRSADARWSGRESGCSSFDWSRNVDDPQEYVLVEAFRDEASGVARVSSPHFKATPAQLDHDDWSELGEMAVDR
jgi:quinol monooxygenase YgiN